MLNQTERIEPGRVLVVDGIFALHYDGLRPLYDLAIYVDTPDDICFTRRLCPRCSANVDARPNPLPLNTPRPFAPWRRSTCRPSAKHAGLVLDGTAALDWLLEQVLANFGIVIF